ncbi:MAG: hypothetical protein QOC89_4135 [Paraburkholderia sp.]|jgi:hypothetical protein|uniref:hypothetical protein n=1 Tax=Paraburkholderia sp. TaxID=1926495 RepID=UPI002B001EE8|nr:hypothetical protein [Paraburkholderia sp.]MEA3086438.1 hypothetical protein [Paraburkholderia sp.]MEA3131419.1 hypothetical protein [Paraburkholderia sp.]
MLEKTAGKSTLGACADLPLEAQLAETGGAGRESIVARLTTEIDAMNSALPGASPTVRKELILLVECLRAARQVVERSVSFTNARDKR